MTRDELESFYDALIKDARGIMFAKSRDYARTANAFDNLERTGADLGLTREQVGMVFLNKHMDSIKGHVRDRDHVAAEPLRGRICDAINYLVMLAGMMDGRDRPTKRYPEFKANGNTATAGMMSASWPFQPGEPRVQLDAMTGQAIPGYVHPADVTPGQ